MSEDFKVFCLCAVLVTLLGLVLMGLVAAGMSTDRANAQTVKLRMLEICERVEDPPRCVEDLNAQIG